LVTGEAKRNVGDESEAKRKRNGVDERGEGQRSRDDESVRLRGRMGGDERARAKSG
jgi:hypothetical protein